MNRDLVGCSTESACGVGLANRQDAQVMCECTNGVNYICGEDEAINIKIKEKTIRGRHSVGFYSRTKNTRPIEGTKLNKKESTAENPCVKSEGGVV